METQNNPQKSMAFYLLILTIPFLLNDFANMYISDFKLWLVVDYTFVKALPIIFLLRLLQLKKISFADLGLKLTPLKPFLLWTFLMIVLGIFIDQASFKYLRPLIPDLKIGGFPETDTKSFLYQFDLYFGLLWVAILEEVIFRGLAFSAFKNKSISITRVFLVSSLIFGLIHWSLGFYAVLNAAVIGAVFMFVMHKTKSVLPTIIAHFFVNYVFFAGIIKY